MSSLFIKNVNILNPFSDEIMDERNVFIKGNKIESVGVNETTLVGSYKVIECRGYKCERLWSCGYRC